MAQVARTMQTGIKYTGEQWAFCPWCGRHLTKYALDGGTGCAPEGVSTPEYLSAGEVDTHHRQ